MKKLINQLISEGVLKSSNIIHAFETIDRSYFLPPEQQTFAQQNTPLPILSGQTNSQPLTVALMLERLEPQSGQKILDIGSGSGRTTALLAEIVGPTGKIVAIETIPQVYEFGKENIKKYGFISSERVTALCQDGTKGYPSQAPYDRILVSASGRHIPPALKQQLAIGGKLVIPVGNTMHILTKRDTDTFEEQTVGGFSFVPLIEN